MRVLYDIINSKIAFVIIGCISIAYLPNTAHAQGIYPDPITIQTQNTAVTSPTDAQTNLQAERERLQAYEQQLQQREQLLDERAAVLDERAQQLDERAQLLNRQEEELATQVPLNEPLIVEPAGPTVEGFFENDADRVNESAIPDTFVPGTGEEFTPGVPEDGFSPGVQDTEQDFFD